MAKLTTTDLANLSNETSAVNTINNNNAAIETAMDNTLSRDGTAPNQMEADLDMNSNRLLNLPAPSDDTEPLRKGDLPSSTERNTASLVDLEEGTTLQAWYDDPEWVLTGDTASYAGPSSITFTGDVTSKYHVGRRLRAEGAATGTIVGTITTSSYSSPTTTLTISWDSGSLSNEVLTVWVGVNSVKSTSIPWNFYDLRAFGSDESAIQLAIDLANSAGGGVVKGDPAVTYTIGSTVTVKNGVTLDFQWAAVNPSADADMFHVNQGGLLTHLRVDATSVSFSSKVATLKPTENVRAADKVKWLDGIVIIGSSGGSEDGVWYDATTYYIQETRAYDVAQYWGNKAVGMTAGAGTYCNGNTILGITTHDPVYTIWEDDTQTINGNIYEGVMSEDNSNGGHIYLNSIAIVSGALWDRCDITFKGDRNRIYAGPGLLQTSITDDGKENLVVGQDGTYFDHRSTNRFGDARPDYLGLPGQIEFREFFDGNALGNHWRTGTNTSGGSDSLQAYSSAGAAYGIAGTRLRLDTGTSTNDDYYLDWGNYPIFAGQNPRFFSTILLGAASNLTVRIGLWADTNNHIILESDVANTKWVAKVTNGGTSTTADITSINFNRLHVLQIIVQNDEVLFYTGNPALGSNSAGYSLQNLSLGATITSNIPTTSQMSPYFWVRTDTASDATLFVYDVQVLRSALYRVV